MQLLPGEILQLIMQRWQARRWQSLFKVALQFLCRRNFTRFQLLDKLKYQGKNLWNCKGIKISNATYKEFCPIVKGTLENLQYLVEAGISVTSNKTLQAEGWRLSQKFEIPEVRIMYNWAKIFRTSHFNSFTTNLCSYSHRSIMLMLRLWNLAGHLIEIFIPKTGKFVNIFSIE